jgi:hypothetical protein
MQGVGGKYRRSDSNINITCSIACHRQTWETQVERGDFSTLTHLALDELKLWNLGYIVQIHDLMETDSQF